MSTILCGFLILPWAVRDTAPSSTHCRRNLECCAMSDVDGRLRKSYHVQVQNVPLALLVLKTVLFIRKPSASEYVARKLARHRDTERLRPKSRRPHCGTSSSLPRRRRSRRRYW